MPTQAEKRETISIKEKSISGPLNLLGRALQETTQSADTSAWPFPIIRYRKREIKLDQLLDQAGNNDERTEAPSYAGLDLLLSGSREEALEHFRWVEEYGNREFVEYKLAAAELRR